MTKGTSNSAKQLNGCEKREVKLLFKLLKNLYTYLLTIEGANENRRNLQKVVHTYINAIKPSKIKANARRNESPYGTRVTTRQNS